LLKLVYFYVTNALNSNTNIKAIILRDPKVYVFSWRHNLNAKGEPINNV
jgi:hypothetical protein